MLGPNGAGKTTAMRIMTGFLAPTRGEVYLEGEPFGPESVEARRRIGYLPESSPLYNDMLAWDYLAYEARVHGIDPATSVPRVIRRVALGSHAHKPIRELSRGFRQRVGLAHALLHDPELLILDEPTSGLDPNQIIEVRALIREIAETTTIILSTHIMQEVEALCDRVLVVHRGRIRYEGPIGEFVAAAEPAAAESGAAESGEVGGVQRMRLLVGGIAFPALREILTAVPGFRDLELLDEISENTSAGTADGPLMRVRLTVENAPDARPRVFRIAAGYEPESGGGVRGEAGPRFILYEIFREKTSLEDVFHDLTREAVHE